MRSFYNAIRIIGMGAALLTVTTNAFAWGQKGHDVTCAVAQKHLTKKAEKKISAVLDGKSIVYWANWMDNASHTDEYAYTKTWHYKNIDADETYETAKLNKNGDVVVALNRIIADLKGGKLSPEQEELSLRMLVHFMGDLHCPMHMGHKSDAGGNKWQVQYFRAGKNLHGIWDSDIVESAHKWSRSEWVEEIDRSDKAGIKAIQAGTPDDWAKETYTITCEIYDTTPKGSKLSYDYVSKWAPVIEQQLERGGLRLARILNEIYK